MMSPSTPRAQAAPWLLALSLGLAACSSGPRQPKPPPQPVAPAQPLKPAEPRQPKQPKAPPPLRTSAAAPPLRSTA